MGKIGTKKDGLSRHINQYFSLLNLLLFVFIQFSLSLVLSLIDPPKILHLPQTDSECML